jgi:hypothetical protein
MKIDKLKVFNSVKIGSKEETFLKSEDYDMFLEDQLIKIVSKKSGDTSYTSLANVPYFTKLKDRDNSKENEQDKSSSNTKRATKKKAKSSKLGS